MATATEPKPTSSNGSGTPPPLAVQSVGAFGSLWQGRRIPIVGVTGEFGSGKTLFGLTVDPGTRDHSTHATTLCWDTEGSSEPYVDMLNFDRVDVTAGLGDDYSPIDLYLRWRQHIQSIQPGKYRVGFLDTIEEIEEGLVEWVRANPDEFGHTKVQYEAMSGLMWGDVKSLWQRILYTEIRERFETFVFAAHLKNEWKGKAPTGNKVPKGKETLMKLASLYLELMRIQPAKGKTGQAIPSANVMKTRLTVLHPKTGELIPMLPPRLDVATPDAIRAYIVAPPDYAALKPSERLQEKTMSDDERLAMQAQIASDQAATAQAELSRVEKVKEAAARAADRRSAQNRKADAGRAAAVVAGASESDASAASVNHCSPIQESTIRELAPKVFSGPAKFAAELARVNAKKIADLTMQQADSFIAYMQSAVEATLVAAEQGQPVRSHVPDDAVATNDSGPATKAQLQRINDKAASLDLTLDDSRAILNRFGVAKGIDLTGAQADEIYQILMAREGKAAF